MPSRRSSHILVRSAAAAAILIGASGAANMVIASAAYAQAPRDAGAEQFVQAHAQRVVSVLNDKSQATAD